MRILAHKTFQAVKPSPLSKTNSFLANSNSLSLTGLTHTAKQTSKNTLVSSTGQEIDVTNRSLMEPRFDLDFSYVPVHANEKVAVSARVVNAQTYTIGNNISFSNKAHQPDDFVVQQKCIECEQEPRDIKSLGVQGKLSVGSPNDKYEQEADRVANQIIRMPQLTAVEGKELIQAKPKGELTPQVAPAISSNIRSMQGGGQPLPRSVRNFFEPRFGIDFSTVRVHSDSVAAGVARSINARAFTLGHDIVFGVGQYSPHSPEGKTLLAHELVHTVQQGVAIYASDRGSSNTLHGISSDNGEVVRRAPPRGMTFSLPHADLLAVENRIVQAVASLGSLASGRTFAERVAGYLAPLSRHITYRNEQGLQRGGREETIQFSEGRNFSLRLVLSDEPNPQYPAYFVPNEGGAGGSIVLTIRPPQEISEEILPRATRRMPGEEASEQVEEEESTPVAAAPQTDVESLLERLNQPYRSIGEQIQEPARVAETNPTGIEQRSAQRLSEDLYHETMHFVMYCLQHAGETELTQERGADIERLNVERYLESEYFGQSISDIETIIRCVNEHSRGESDQIPLTNAREYAAFVIDEALAMAETQRLLCLQSSSCTGLMQRGRVAAAYLFLHLMRREDRMALEQNEEAAEAYRMLGVRLGTLISDRARNLG